MFIGMVEAVDDVGTSRAMLVVEAPDTGGALTLLEAEAWRRFPPSQGYRLHSVRIIIGPVEVLRATS